MAAGYQDVGKPRQQEVIVWNRGAQGNLHFPNLQQGLCIHRAPQCPPEVPVLLSSLTQSSASIGEGSFEGKHRLCLNQTKSALPMTSTVSKGIFFFKFKCNLLFVDIWLGA